jgi:hypothetical protein
MEIGDRTVDGRRMGKFSFTSDQDVTETDAAENRRAYRPLKRILGLGSMRPTARRPKSTIRNS